MQTEHIRNVAIIAHVDHGKTTLVDKMLYQSGMFRNEELDHLVGGRLGLIMDSNPLERERGITILAKNCAVYYTPRTQVEPVGNNGNGTHHLSGGRDRLVGEQGPRQEDRGTDQGKTLAESHAAAHPTGRSEDTPERYKINIIDTPGHADFGGEVERVLKMADGVVLLVDAFEGPMPQTRFVLQKALHNGLRPIVLVNKVDRPDARPHDVVNEVFDLLIELGADDYALDFPVIFASAKEGWATLDLEEEATNLEPLFNAIIKYVPPPTVRPDDPLQMLVTTLDYSDYIGRIGIGKVVAGNISQGERVAVIDREGQETFQRVIKLLTFEGLGRKEIDNVTAGDICAVVGLDPVDIGDTITDAEEPIQLPTIAVDEPTLHMTFRINDGPFAGREGTYVTSRQIKERLERELRSNVALRVAQGDTSDEFKVSGRGLMHLGILLENMRREGYELCAGKPKVIFKEVDGKIHEPIELLVISCPVECQSAVMSLLGDRRSEMVKMEAKAGTTGFIYMEFRVPARGLIGLASRMMNATQGRAILHHTFEEYAPMRGEIPQRLAGVMMASNTGTVTAYALDALYDRGFFFVRPGDQVYEGQVVGEHCMEKDITVNVVKIKQMSNMRASSKDDAAKIRPAREMGLEASLEYIQDDELVEITPKNIRMRKRLLTEIDRKRAGRKGAAS